MTRDGEWDAYKGQDIVIMNDFRGHIPYDQLLQLIDKYPVKVRRSGRGPTSFLAKHIIITSSLRPENVHHNRNENDDIPLHMYVPTAKLCVAILDQVHVLFVLSGLCNFVSLIMQCPS